MISYEQALSRVAERTISNQKNISQRTKQRRTGFVDLYGVESFRSIDGSGTFFISISPDLEYFERYQFKIAVDSPTSVGNVQISIDGIDITAYLTEQQGSWIDGEGIFPSDDIESENEWEDFYDILDVCGLMVAGGEEENADKILSSGVHRLKISGLSADVTLILYMKYSHINR